MKFELMSRSLTIPFPKSTWPCSTTLETIETEDAAADAHSLISLAYADGGGTVASFDSWWPDLKLDAEFDHRLCVLVRSGAGVLVAFAQCWTSAFIKDLVVHPAHRRQGLGRALLFHVFSIFSLRGADAVRLKVYRTNRAAIALYRAAAMRTVTS